MTKNPRSRMLGVIMWRTKNKAGRAAETYNLYGSVPLPS